MNPSPRSCFDSFLHLVAVTIVLLFSAVTVIAQTSEIAGDPQVDSGVHPYGTYDGAHVNVSLATGNMSFCIPLVSLPGRHHHDLNIPLCHNSQFKEPGGAYQGGMDRLSWFPWTWGASTPPMGPGWTLTGRPGMYLSGFLAAPVGATTDGGIYGFPNTQEGGPIFTGADTSGANMYSAFTSNGAYELYLEDGTRVLPGSTSNSSLVYDTNGNYIDYESNQITDTIGRTVNVTASADGSSSSIAFSYPDSNGATQTVTVQMAIITYNCTSGSSTFGANGTYSMPSAVIYPNGLTYTFQYDGCGNVTEITYPSGGYTRFIYDSGRNVNGSFEQQVLAKYECPAAAVASGSTIAPGGTSATSADTCPVPENPTTYTPTVGTYNNSQNIVIDPLGNQTVYQFTQLNVIADPGSPPVETSRQIYQGNSQQGTAQLLKTITTQYTSTTNVGTVYSGSSFGTVPALPTVQTTTLPNGMVSQIQWSYDWRNAIIGDTVLTDKYEYDFGAGAPGPLLRHTVYTWLQRVNPAYDWPGAPDYGGHILDRKTSETVYDGSGNLVAQTNYVYDCNNSPCASVPRGNLTSVSRWDSATSAWLTTSYQYDSYGNVISKTDPKGNVTQFSFADNYSDGVNRDSNAFLTKTTYPSTNGVAHVAQYQYDWGSGLVAASCGENYSGTCEAGNSSGADYATYSYDMMGRKISTTTGDGGQTTVSYSDAYPLQITTSETISSGVTKVSRATLDGLGRTVKSQLMSDPQGTVEVDTTYDGNGHQSTVSNPYRATSDPTYGITTYAYDGLDRVTRITHPDGTFASNIYTGRAVLSSDEGNGKHLVQRISQIDALGRLRYVCEVTNTTQNGSTGTPSSCGLDYGGTGFLTTYAYDALGDLINVTQGGESRGFDYDSLSELKSATNPESGTTTYSYDSDGNLISKTDALGKTTTYSYDSLNRLTGKTYSDGTASACFSYDNSYNGTGRMSAEWTQAGTCGSTLPSNAITHRSFTAYDLLGRVASDQQMGPAVGGTVVPYTFNYGYDLAGNVTSFTNGLTSTSAVSLMSFSSQYNAANRLAMVNGVQSSGTYDMTNLFTANGYNPAGSLTDAAVGQGISFHRDYNNRLLPTDETDQQGTSPGTATVQITGSEQDSGFSSGSLTFSGAEQSTSGNATATFAFSGTEQSVTSGSTVTYNVGSLVAMIFNGGTSNPPCEAYITYGEGSTAISLATAMASSINSSCSTSVSATSSGAAVTVTAVVPGATGDYSIEITGGGNTTPMPFSATPSTMTMTGGTYDSGVFQIMPFGASVPPIIVDYSSTDTPQTLAANAASDITCGSTGGRVQAVASGPTVYLVSCQAGTATNYPLTAQLIEFNRNNTSFAQPSFAVAASGATMTPVVSLPSEPSNSISPLGPVTISGAAVAGQSGAYTIIIYPGQPGQTESGPPTMVGTVEWGPTSTAASIAASFAASFSSCSTAGTLITASYTAGSSVVTLSSCQAGTSYEMEIVHDAGSAFTVTSSSYVNTLPGVTRGAIFDTGTATLSIAGSPVVSITYGAGATPASIVAGLVAAGSGNGFIKLQASASDPASLVITAFGDGTARDSSYSLEFTYDTTDFTEPSFGSSAPSGALTGATNAPLYNWAITSYAPDGDVLAMTDSVMGTWQYTQDDMNRLVNAQATAGADVGMNLAWTYDRYGNRWSQLATGTGTATATQGTLTFTSNTNRIDGYSYDAAGNLLYDGIHHYTYDAENRIATIDGAPAYVYDAEGRRVAKLNASGAVTASYALGLGGEQVSELNGAGVWVHSNVFVGGRLMATYAGPGDAVSAGYYYHLTDWLGTQRMQTTATGAVSELCSSYPFGDGLSCTGEDATEHHFTSKERDVESGLDYFGARYLSSNLGRWMTPDWAAAPTDVPYANFGDPQTLNLYAYVSNNPNTGIDMDGHDGVVGLSGFEDHGGFWESEPMSPVSNSSSGSDSKSGSGGAPGTPTTPPAPSNNPAPVPQPDIAATAAAGVTAGAGALAGVVQDTKDATPPGNEIAGGGNQAVADASNAAANNGTQRTPGYCIEQSAWKNGVAAVTDGIGAIPGEGQGLALLQLGAAGVSFVNSLATVTPQNANWNGAGAAGSLVGGQITGVNLAMKSMGTALPKLIPFAGNAFSAVMFVHDLQQAKSDYDTCMAGGS